MNIMDKIPVKVTLKEANAKNWHMFQEPTFTVNFQLTMPHLLLAAVAMALTLAARLSVSHYVHGVAIKLSVTTEFLVTVSRVVFIQPLLTVQFPLEIDL